MKKLSRTQIKALDPTRVDETPRAATTRLLREALRNLRHARNLIDCGLVGYSDPLERTGALLDVEVADLRRVLDIAQVRKREGRKARK